MRELDETVFVNLQIQEEEKRVEENRAEEAGAIDVTSNMELKELYAQLGKAYYEGGFEDPLPELLPLFDKITKIKSVKPQVYICNACGKELSKGSMFCGGCGARVN